MMHNITIKAECPKHGIQEIVYEAVSDAWFCNECFLRGIRRDCMYSVTAEEMEKNPDGGKLTRKCPCRRLDEKGLTHGQV